MVTEYVSKLVDYLGMTNQLVNTEMEVAHRYHKNYYGEKCFGDPLQLDHRMRFQRAQTELYKEWYGSYLVERVLFETKIM